jgi:hypothetical protein
MDSKTSSQVNSSKNVSNVDDSKIKTSSVDQPEEFKSLESLGQVDELDD